MGLSFDLDGLSKDDIQRDGLWEEESAALDHDSDWGAMNLHLSMEHIARIERIDGKPLEDQEIQYVVSASHLHDFVTFDDDQRFRVVIVDLGSSRTFNDCNHRLQQVNNYRPPEAIIPIPVTYKADIFTAGLVFWHIITLSNFVWTHYEWPRPGLANEDRADNRSYINDLCRRIGPMPDDYAALFPLGNLEELVLPTNEKQPAWGDMRFAARKRRPEDMTDADLELFIDLMSQMMQWEPEKRPDTGELLKHPFFATD